MIKTYIHRKVVKAIRYTGNNGTEIKQFTKGQAVQSPVLESSKDNPTGAYLQIVANGDWLGFAIPGDYIVMDEHDNVSCWTEEDFNKYFTLKDDV